MLPLRLARLACLVLPVVLVSSAGIRAGRALDVRVESFELLNAGVAAYNRGEYAAAAEALERASSMALNSFRAYYYLGLARIGERRYREAIDALEIALDLDPEHLRALIGFGDAHRKLGDIEEARAAYFRALKLRPAYAPALDGLARSYESEADDDRAIELYRKAIAADSGFAPAHTHLGVLYLRQDRLEEAVEMLEQAIEVRPDFAPGMSRLALAYGRLGLDNEAVALVQKAMELDPRNPEHPTALGALQLGQAQLHAAEQSFLAALELDPGLPEAQRGLAEIDRRRGRYDRALATVERALDDARLTGPARDGLERLATAIAEERERVSELNRRLDAGEASASDHAALAAIYADRGRWTQAIEHQRELPPSIEQRERLAYLLYEAGRFREADDVYAELARETDRLDLHLNRGVTLAMLGDDRGAIEAYREVLRRDPDHRLARLYLGNALLRAGRTEEAARTYREFLGLGREGEAAERVRRILAQIAPELVPSAPPRPAAQPGPPPPPRGGLPDEESAS